jgi:hypothetical protein
LLRSSWLIKIATVNGSIPRCSALVAQEGIRRESLSQFCGSLKGQLSTGFTTQMRDRRAARPLRKTLAARKLAYSWPLVLIEQRLPKPLLCPSFANQLRTPAEIAGRDILRAMRFCRRLYDIRRLKIVVSQYTQEGSNLQPSVP